MSSPLTTHVLDTALGRPATGLLITLERLESNGAWSEISQGRTNEDGRLRDLLPTGGLEAKTYRLTFHCGEYFGRLGHKTFYPFVPVVFEISAVTEHHHVPLLISPFGYSTYRGS
jgi:5-hydroxyisourate hydrolase